MDPEVVVAIEKAAAEPEFSADSTVEREVASVPAEAAVEAQLCFIDKVVEVDGCCSRCGLSNEPTTFSGVRTFRHEHVHLSSCLAVASVHSVVKLLGGRVHLLTNCVDKLLGGMF